MKHRNKDSAIELLRIVAACQVIGTHVKLDSMIDGRADTARFVIASVVGDGVAIFWMILGFFYFSSTDARKRLGRLCRRVLLPMAAYTVFMFYCFDYIQGYDPTLLASLKHTLQDYKELVAQGLLKWQPTLGGTSHLWYLYVYVLMVLITPLLIPVRDALMPDGKHERRVMLGIFALMLFNDLSFNGFLDITHHTTGGMIGATLWVLTGDIVYRRRALFKGKWGLGLAGLAVWAAANAVRTWVHYRFMTAEPLYWYSSYAYVSTLGITVFVYGFSGLLERFGWLRAVVNHLGAMTFGVYIWHLPILSKLKRINVQSQAIDRLGNAGLGAVRYQLVYTALIFAAALAVTEALSLLGKGIRLAAGRVKRPNPNT